MTEHMNSGSFSFFYFSSTAPWVVLKWSSVTPTELSLSLAALRCALKMKMAYTLLKGVRVCTLFYV